MNKNIFAIILAILVATAFSLSNPLARATEKKVKEKLAVLDLDAKYGIEKSFAEEKERQAAEIEKK